MKKLIVSAALSLLIGTAGAGRPDPPAITSIRDIGSLLGQHQTAYLIVSPPVERIFLYPYECALPMDSRSMPQRFLTKLIPERSAQGLIFYRVIALEDAASRDVVLLNAAAVEVGRLSALKNYDPFSYAKELIGEEAWLEVGPENRWFYDPSRVGAVFTLVDAADYDTFVLDERIAAAVAANQRAMSIPPATPLSGQGVTNTLHLSICQTNGATAITAHWPDTFTDPIEVFAISNLQGWPWSLVRTNIVTSTGSSFTWSDTASTNLTTRFYVAGNAVLDSDGDALADARERYLHGTQEDMRDGDGDGMGDGFEIKYGLNPFSASGADGSLGDADGDGFGNLEEELKGTNPGIADANTVTGTVATLRYYYDVDDRLTDFFCDTSAAERTTASAADNIVETVEAGN